MLDDISRSDTYPYIDIQEDDTTMTHEATVGKISADQVFYLMSRGLTENEATEPDRPGLPRGVHEGAPDGVRDRVQPSREARDGGVARVTLARPRATTARAARRAPADLSFTLDEATVEALAADEPDWLAADRRAALALFASLPSEGNQLYTPVHRPARGGARRRPPLRVARGGAGRRHGRQAARRHRRPRRSPRGPRRGAAHRRRVPRGRRPPRDAGRVACLATRRLLSDCSATPPRCPQRTALPS